MHRMCMSFYCHTPLNGIDVVFHFIILPHFLFAACSIHPLLPLPISSCSCNLFSFHSFIWYMLSSFLFSNFLKCLCVSISYFPAYIITESVMALVYCGATVPAFAALQLICFILISPFMKYTFYKFCGIPSGSGYLGTLTPVCCLLRQVCYKFRTIQPHRTVNLIATKVFEQLEHCIASNEFK